MASIQLEDKTIELAENFRLGELIEAENALGLNMAEASAAAQVALVVYISYRRVEPNMPKGLMADTVLRMDLSALVDEEAGLPLGNGASASESGQNGHSGTDSETSEPQTSGSRPTASSE